ncbi:MAG: bile acid:sodium symporter family protein, partial [Xenococcaceae cyanobacterium]
MQIAAIAIIPVLLGMVLHYYKPQLAAKLEKLVKWFSLFFLSLIIFGLLLKERANLSSFFLQVGWVTFTLSISTMALGYAIATFAKLHERSAKAITLEVGIQNGTLALAVASAPTFLNNPTMAIPAAIYSLLMYLPSAAFAWLTRHREAAS